MIQTRMDLSTIPESATQDIRHRLLQDERESISAGIVPTFARRDITWRNVTAETVEISIDLYNPFPVTTEPDDLVVEVAPLGAFIPFTPVTRIAVGGLEPDERRRVSTRVPMARLGNVDLARLAELHDQGATWIGNLNVYFESSPERAVERHCAFDLCVRAGAKHALGMFFIERHDPRLPVFASLFMGARSQEFEVVTSLSNPAWSAESIITGPLGTLMIETPDVVPSDCEVVVEVTRSCDRTTVPVEFTFTTREGQSDTIGCVTVGK